MDRADPGNFTRLCVERALYFGALFPHTVSCKAFYAGNPLGLIQTFWSFAWVPIILSYLINPKRVGPGYLLILGLPVINGVILYGVDPIIASENRHFLAAYALVLIGGAVGLSHLTTLIFRQWDRGLREFLVFAIWASFIGLPTATANFLKGDSSHYAGRMEARRQAGLWLQEHLEPDESYIVGDAGAIPYYAEREALDAFCLTNKDALGPDGERRSAEDYVAKIMEREPKAIVVHSDSAERLRPHTLYNFYPILVREVDLEHDYVLKARFGYPGDLSQYWIFMREGDEAVDE